MMVNYETIRTSYALFHKLTLCFIKLAGLDPNVNLRSQMRSESHYSNRVMKLFSWIYSLSILAVLLAFSELVLSSSLDTKIGVVYFIWNLSYGVQMFHLLLVFIVRNRRISKMNDVLTRWIKTYFSKSKMPLTGVSVWGL